MKIAVDLRSLHSTEFSGVESYTVKVLEKLLTRDRENSYTLFYNGFKPKQFDSLHFINAKYKQTRIPNRLLNLSMKFFNKPRLEKLVGDCDVLFMPNWNVCSVDDKTKVILTVHDLSPLVLPQMYNWKSRAWHSFINIKKLVKRADALIAVSEHTKIALQEVLKVPEQKITVAPLGVEQEFFNPSLDVDQLRQVRNIYGLPGDFILFLGTIEPRKNLETLIDAFERVNSPVNLVIAGKLGWKYKAITQRIEKSKKRRQIKLLGYIPEADKPYIMKLAKTFVWPSLYEGFGLPVLEAMAVGTPALTSQLTSLPEVAGSTALLVNPYNPQDIASGLEDLLTNEQLRQRFTVQGIERAKNFTWDKTATILESVIKKLG